MKSARNIRLFGSTGYKAICVVLVITEMAYLADLSTTMAKKYAHFSQVGNGLIFILESTAYIFLAFSSASLGLILVGRMTVGWRRGWSVLLAASCGVFGVFSIFLAAGLIKVI